MIHFPELFVKSCIFDKLGRYAPEVKNNAMDEHTMHCTLTFSLDEEVQQNDWQLCLIPSFEPDFHWAPHLTPEDRHIMDQHCFRSPALIAQAANRTLMLIPDLDLLSEETPVRWYMDMDAPNNKMVIGMSHSRIDGHVLFERETGASYRPGTVSIGFYLMMFDDEEIAANPWRPVLKLLWGKWGSPRFHTGAPHVAPLMRYIKHTYDWAFDHWNDVVWQEFDMQDGAHVGAPVFIVDVSQSPNFPGVANERESRSIWNQAWFSSLRSAHGLYRYGREQDDLELVRKSLLTKELALSAPQQRGFFPAVLATKMEQVKIEDQLVHRSDTWDRSFWGNSNRNPVLPWGSIADAPYHVLDMSWTTLLMLRWYEELEIDPRLLDYAKRYADALLSLQDAKGYFPAWLDQKTLEPLKPLSESPETSLSVTFLLKMFDLIPDPKYKTAALKSMEIVMKEIIPIGRWEDFETYWSCCSYGQNELPGSKVIRNDMFKHCNFSMFWTAEALYRCYQLIGDRRYLSTGQRCLDELLMTQASWQPPFIYVETLGGFGVMNCDGEWNDARQSLYAELILQYGIELDHIEYIERGIAALRASFVMMYCPENPKTKVQWEKAYPFFNEKDYGFMMENYGHSGEVNEEGQGMGRFTIFDWGNGAAAEAYLRIKAHLGNVLRERYGYEI